MDEESLILKYLDRNYYIKDYCFYDKLFNRTYLAHNTIIGYLCVIFGMSSTIVEGYFRGWCCNNGLIDTDFSFYTFADDMEYLYSNPDTTTIDKLRNIFLTQIFNEKYYVIDINNFYKIGIDNLYKILRCLGISVTIGKSVTNDMINPIFFDTVHVMPLLNYRVQYYRLNTDQWHQLVTEDIITPIKSQS